MTAISRAVRKHCLECSGGSADVALCLVRDCPLWPFRLGCRSNEARQRVEETWARGGEAVEAAQNAGLAITDFIQEKRAS